MEYPDRVPYRWQEPEAEDSGEDPGLWANMANIPGLVCRTFYIFSYGAICIGHAVPCACRIWTPNSKWRDWRCGHVATRDMCEGFDAAKPVGIAFQYLNLTYFLVSKFTFGSWKLNDVKCEVRFRADDVQRFFPLSLYSFRIAFLEISPCSNAKGKTHDVIGQNLWFFAMHVWRMNICTSIFYVHQGGFWPIPRCRYWWFLLPGYTGYVQSTIEAQGTMAQARGDFAW